MDKSTIAILTTVANFELYRKTSLYFPIGVKKYVIDGRQGMHGLDSLLFMMKKLKSKGIKWLIMADEDVIFKNSDFVFSLINQMHTQNKTVCGVRDGGVISHRKFNPYVINTFFSILHLEEVINVWDKKEMLAHQRVYKNEFKDNLFNLKFDYDTRSLYEPYYCFYLWLRRQNKYFMFLESSMDKDGISNEVYFNSQSFFIHTWYARSYGVNKNQTERINKHLQNTNTQKFISGDDNVTIFKDRFYALRKNIKKIVKKIKMKIYR